MKQVMDFFISVMLMTLFSPLVIFISVIVRLRMGSPVLFKQQRPGIFGRPFYLYKFRTMTNLTDKKGNMLSDEIRLTPLGAFLRKYSMDEFPQLINVLKGEMSLVGPRPLLMEYLPLYNEKQRMRQNVKPGITGWAQVNGRNALTWDEKFKLDTWYVNHQSISLDCKILWMTFVKVLKKEGISHQGSVTMEKFNGNQEAL
ncbi:sugar transferase [Virgibacillus indicus]|uniref:Sugar transferase n=1 Tax=Virgibacillus indicus TaxID=2024554 RepID=A0A265NBT9_9BACI|nr:sugar transferase [Virgibacillus indicus]OZU89287.1 sugar transferase [Virgibacillus indicus]